MSIKTPRLIRDRCGVYYFRLIVPLALRQFTGKAEFRRSLRTKDSLVARQRALSLSLAVESMMVSPKFLSNPTLADFPHLLRSDAKQGIREKIRIDLEKGIIETDTVCAPFLLSWRCGISQALRAVCLVSGLRPVMWCVPPPALWPCRCAAWLRAELPVRPPKGAPSVSALLALLWVPHRFAMKNIAVYAINTQSKGKNSL